MQHTLSESSPARLFHLDERALDHKLPEWARRTNPIVRRELGIYWKIMPIDGWQIGRYMAFQGVIIALSLLAPFLLALMMPFATISIVVLPMVFVLYIYSLFHLTIQAARSMVNETVNDSLDLLRVCPRPLQEILYSKGAAAVWRQIENLGLVIIGTALCSLPLLIIFYDQWVNAVEQPLLMRVGVATALITSVLRIPLEAALGAALGVLVGSMVRQRTPAQLASALLLLAYFVLINALRLPAWSTEIRFIVETVLPLAVPLLLITLCFRLAVWRLGQD